MGSSFFSATQPPTAIFFAHGGSGFVVSQPALRTVVDHNNAHKAEIEEFTAGHWAGDCVLGKVFTDSGVPFTNAWPAFQVDYPGLVQCTGADARVNDQKSRLWYGTPISYHHMSAAMVEEMWNFEQNWSARHNADADTFRHRDVFAELIMPQMMTPRTDWDNLSDQEDGTFASVDECRVQCIAQPSCKQYSLDQDRMFTNINPRLGKAVQGVTSGWIEDRVRMFQQGMAPCKNESWPFQRLSNTDGKSKGACNVVQGRESYENISQINTTTKGRQHCFEKTTTHRPKVTAVIWGDLAEQSGSCGFGSALRWMHQCQNFDGG